MSTWSHIARYLDSFENYYPTIQTWFAKVQLEIPTGRRSVLALVSATGEVAGLAITKNGLQAKLCHISVADHAREDGLGALLMHAALLQMASFGAAHVRVTTGEEVAASYGDFFSRCGFACEGARRNRYRRGVDELEWAASMETLLQRFAGAQRYQASQSFALTRLQASDDECRWAPIPWQPSSAFVGA